MYSAMRALTTRYSGTTATPTSKEDARLTGFAASRCPSASIARDTPKPIIAVHAMCKPW